MEGKLHCISGMNGHPNQMPDSSFNFQSNYSSLSVLSGLLSGQSSALLSNGPFWWLSQLCQRTDGIQIQEVMLSGDAWNEVRGALFGLLGRKYIDQHSKNVGTAAFSFARHCWCIHLMLYTRNDEQEWEKSLHYWKSWEVAVRGELVEEKFLMWVNVSYRKINSQHWLVLCLLLFCKWHLTGMINFSFLSVSVLLSFLCKC